MKLDFLLNPERCSGFKCSFDTQPTPLFYLGYSRMSLCRAICMSQGNRRPVESIKYSRWGDKGNFNACHLISSSHTGSITLPPVLSRCVLWLWLSSPFQGQGDRHLGHSSQTMMGWFPRRRKDWQTGCHHRLEKTERPLCGRAACSRKGSVWGSSSDRRCVPLEVRVAHPFCVPVSSSQSRWWPLCSKCGGSEWIAKASHKSRMS
jgi:hypothetical protein